MEIQNLKTLCEQFFHQADVRAMDVAVHQNGQEVFHFRSGNTMTKGPKITEKTMFSIGSVSKMFTSTAVMMLVESGKLSLDEPVYKKLPMFKMADPRYKNITVRMLLNHSSGLPGNCFRGKYTNARNRSHLKEEMDYAAKSRLKDQPGKFSVYCNDGFSLAELLIEVISGQSYAAFVFENILEPLAMEHTDFPLYELMDDKYIRAKGPFDLDFPQEYVNGIGSGGIYSTAEDLCLFFDGLMSGKLISPESLAEMNKDQQPKQLIVADNTTERYGLGWDCVELRLFEGMKLQALSKSGSTFGFSSHSLIIPELNLSAAVVLCADKGSPSALNQQLVYELIRTAHPFAPTPLKALNTITHPVEITGLYGNKDQIVRARFENGDLTLEIRDRQGKWQPEAAGLALKDGYYCGAYESCVLGRKAARLAFIRADERIYLIVDQPGAVQPDQTERQALFQKLNPETRQSGWQNLIGKTWIMDNEYIHQRTLGNVPMTFTVQMEKGYDNLILSPYPLMIRNDQQAVPAIEIPGNYSREMSSVRVLDDGSVQLGQYHFMLCEGLGKLDFKELVLRDHDTHWYIGERSLDTMKLDGAARCVVLDENGDVEFDSMLCSKMPESIRGKRIGFFGELNSKINLTYLEEQA